MNGLELRQTSGFVSVIGKPNAGKSTLLNTLSHSTLALVSRKANATRKRMNFIVPFCEEGLDSQIVFTDTPGISRIDVINDLNTESKLNMYMMNEAFGAIGDCDICLFVVAANANDIGFYKQFLERCKKPHVIVLNKIDRLSQNSLLACLKSYQDFQKHYLALIPLSAQSLQDRQRFNLLSTIARYLPNSPHLYDNSIASTTLMRDIFKEAIRESIFERMSDEIPYQSDVRILKVIEKIDIIHIIAEIITNRDSQKSMLIGKKGKTIKSLGTLARLKCECIAEKKVFLSLQVKTVRGWSNDSNMLVKMGYKDIG
ncbi:GTPase Era [Helicobacter muridarum]|nr:GTPase Era [Helicobacter muridarum]TLE00196.1 GTPase Era [Helicobacter muridarum]